LHFFFLVLFKVSGLKFQFLLENPLCRGRLEEYMELLVNSFNAAAAEGIMCRNTLSVGWDGRIFDCDFNQQLDIGLPRSNKSDSKQLKTVFDLGTFEELTGRPIGVASHCYGCTGGEGSSCQGATS
jgi:hypothetical protein